MTMIEKEIRTIIPILARRCGIMEDEVIDVMWKVVMNKKKEIIQLLKEAVELAGDGGICPFTEEERIELNNFLENYE